MESALQGDVLHVLHGFDWADEWRRAAAARAAGEPWCAPAIEIADSAGVSLYVQVAEDGTVTFHYEHPIRENHFGFSGSDATESVDACGASMTQAENAIDLFYHFNDKELMQLLAHYRVADEDDSENE